ncbi:MAG: LysR family transcriptional regulator [Archangium gephyra]|uniref:LysR family transcriptional regulator n=1 Tax=Archangium gephyra TaxID=48 RepID=A0A2W5TNL8_9BACT|nr:MAG: LysR family transcriptional regulator [Archangium gephyra]
MAVTPLNSLNAFVAVARKLSYAAAARELGVSTSALSQSVRQLEQRVGLPLLQRTSRSVALTDAGQRLLQNAGPAIDQALDSLKTVTAEPGEVSGRIRMTVPGMATELVLNKLVPPFVRKFPKVELEIRVEGRLIDAVAEGYDAGIRLIEAIDRDMVHVRLSPAARFVVAASPAYLERNGTPQKPEDLLQHECIGMRTAIDRPLYAWELERGKKTWRVPVRGSIVSNDPVFMRSLAVSGVGLIYSFEPSIEAELSSGKLRLVLESYAAEVPGLFLYFPSRAQVSPALKAFVEFARDEMKNKPKR